jgi:hypothetical protein
MERIDVFGAEIGLNYKGKSKYRTKLGALLTLLSVAAICCYAAGQFSNLASGRLKSLVSYE